MAASRFPTVVGHVLMVGHIKVDGESALDTFVLHANNSFGAYSFASLKSTYFVS